MPVGGGKIAAVRRHRLRAVAAAAAVVTLLVVAALGGFEDVRDRQSVDVAPGTAVDVGPVVVTVADVRVLSARQAAVTPVAGESFDDVLVVLADVEVTARRSHLDYRWAVEPVDRSSLVDGPQRYPALLLARNGQPAEALQPHLPERVAWVWPITRGAPVPTSVDLRFGRRELRRSSFSGVQQWFPVRAEDDVPRLLRRVPVADRRRT